MKDCCRTGNEKSAGKFKPGQKTFLYVAAAIALAAVLIEQFIN